MQKNPISSLFTLLSVLTETKLNLDYLPPHLLPFTGSFAQKYLRCQMQVPHNHPSEAPILSVGKNFPELLWIKTAPDHCGNCLPQKKKVCTKTQPITSLFFALKMKNPFSSYYLDMVCIPSTNRGGS